jgi:hypothetical protein
MNVQEYIDHVYDPMDDRQKIETARALASYTDQPRVMDALCETVVNATNHTVREAIIDILKTHNCREAKDAVISGLYDPDADVRKAAAMNAGLYADENVKEALEQYMHNHRLDLSLSLIADRLKSIRNRTGLPDEDDDCMMTVLV